MKKLIFLFLLFLKISIFASTPWSVLIKTYNKEKFCIKFPQKPDFMSYDLKYFKNKGLFIKSFSSNVKYCLQIAEKYIKDENQILQNALDNLKRFPSVSIVKHSFKKEDKTNILDVIFKDHFTSTICRAKIIVTSKNVYSLFTSYKKGVCENHNLFIDSFHIAS